MRIPGFLLRSNMTDRKYRLESKPESIPENFFVLFYLADVALIEIHLDMTGQAILPDFLDVFTEA